MPVTPVKTSTEAYSEMIKSQHALGSVSAHTVLTAGSWIGTEAIGSYIISQDLEYLHGKSAAPPTG